MDSVYKLYDLEVDTGVPNLEIIELINKNYLPVLKLAIQRFIA